MAIATIQKRSETTYTISVSNGYNSKGKQIRKTKTIKVPEKITKKQLDALLKKESILFEEEVERGNYLDGNKITFEEFSNKWFREYAEKQLRPSTYTPYRRMLNKRIVPAIGHIKLSKLQPHHLMSFYNNLGEEGVRISSMFTATKAMLDEFENYTTMQLVDKTYISFKTIARMKEGEQVRGDTASIICEKLGWSLEDGFESVVSGKLSSKTIKHHHSLINSILNMALKWNLIPFNPASRVDTLKVEKYKPKYYDEAQLAKMFYHIENEPIKYKTAIYMIIETGIRIGELAGLTWVDVDFNNKKIAINKQRQYVTGHGVVESKPKTDNGIRIISISDTLISMLKDYKKEQIKNKLYCGSAWVESENVFIHEDGKVIFPRRIYVWFTGFLKRNELDKITVHQLRHTNASLLVADGVDIVTISSRLGHGDKNVTLNTYSHIINSKEEQVASNMEKFYGKVATSTK